jgi:hypothetical protein
MGLIDLREAGRSPTGKGSFFLRHDHISSEPADVRTGKNPILVEKPASERQIFPSHSPQAVWNLSSCHNGLIQRRYHLPDEFLVLTSTGLLLSR